MELKQQEAAAPKGRDGVRYLVADAARENGIDTSVLLNDLIDCFGGPQRLARAMHAEFINAKPGSMVRTRTLEMIQRLVMANTQYELTNLRKPADMETDDIEREIQRLMSKKDVQGATETSAAISAEYTRLLSRPGPGPVRQAEEAAGDPEAHPPTEDLRAR
jgi:hypothetical protein